MKRKLMMLIIMLMVAAMLASFSSALAYDYTLGPVIASNQDGTWIQFDTMKFFDGKLVDPTSVHVTYYTQVTGGPLEGPFNLQYARVSTADSQVKIFFNLDVLPSNVIYLDVTGTLSDGKTFFARGPGWAMGGNIH